MDPIDTTSHADVDKSKEGKKKLSIETEASVEMVHLDRDTPRTSRRKSLFFETVRYFRKEDIARRFVELFPPFGFAEVFVVFFLILMISVSILRATDNLSPVWASYASWSPAFVVFFGAFGLRNNTVGMVLVFAGIGLGIWAIMDEENSDRFFEHGRQAGVLIFVSIGAGWLMRIVLITSHHCGKRKKVRVSLLFSPQNTQRVSNHRVNPTYSMPKVRAAIHLVLPILSLKELQWS